MASLLEPQALRDIDFSRLGLTPDSTTLAAVHQARLLNLYLGINSSEWVATLSLLFTPHLLSSPDKSADFYSV